MYDKSDVHLSCGCVKENISHQGQVTYGDIFNVDQLILQKEMPEKFRMHTLHTKDPPIPTIEKPLPWTNPCQTW
jgi:hypothetical protein